jgi:hypothetical protein
MLCANAPEKERGVEECMCISCAGFKGCKGIQAAEATAISKP